MEKEFSLQQQFIQHLKDKLPPHVSLVDELADLLEISNDSAYRRIRSETQLTLEEAYRICAHYHISLDDLMSTAANMVSFRYDAIDQHRYNMKQYLSNILEDMKMILGFEDREVTYIANDISLFHLLQVPEVAAFKFYFWRKTILNYDMGGVDKFHLEDRNEEVNELSRKIREAYINIPSIEVINAETIDTTLKQVAYYWESGYFKKSDIAFLLLDRLQDLIEHIKSQAEHGFKFTLGSKPFGKENTYKLYFNEVLHTDNTVLVRMGKNTAAYVTTNGLNMMTTTSTRFYQDTQNWVKNLLSKCTLISGTSEKERNRVFRKYQQKIDKMREGLE